MPKITNVQPPIAAGIATAAGTKAPKPAIMPAVTPVDPPGFKPPLDVELKFSPEMVAQYPSLLLKDGQFLSHLETETKWKVDLAKVAEFEKKFEKLVADPALLEKVMGEKGWKLTPVEKYYVKDSAGKVKRGADGLPELNPMVDTYFDTKDHKLAKACAALRFRELEGDKVNNINLKPGPGRVDTATGTATRIEYDMDVAPGTKKNPKLALEFFESNEQLNPFRMMTQVIPGLKASEALNPSVEISDKRYKFILENASGLAIELSLDDVTAKSLDDKKAKPARFAQLEMEVNHMQFHAEAPVDTAAFLANLGSNATLGGPPRIHVPNDVNNPLVPQDPTYIQHSKATAALGKYLYGDKQIELGLQKCNVAATLMGLIK